MQYLPQADLIMTLKDGRIAELGTFEELMNAQGDFRRLFDVRPRLPYICPFVLR